MVKSPTQIDKQRSWQRESLSIIEHSSQSISVSYIISFPRCLGVSRFMSTLWSAHRCLTHFSQMKVASFSQLSSLHAYAMGYPGSCKGTCWSTCITVRYCSSSGSSSGIELSGEP